MKKNYAIILFICVGMISNLFLFSQEKDSAYSVREHKLLEAVDYDYNIIKVNVLRTFNGGIDVQFERRMNLNFSYLSELELVFGPKRERQNLLAGIRYYYNLEKRILQRYEREGLKTSCMSGNYFQADITFGNYTGEYYDSSQLDGVYLFPSFKIGMQRKFWKYCYYDLWMGYRILIPDPRLPAYMNNYFYIDRWEFSEAFILGFSFGVAF